MTDLFDHKPYPTNPGFTEPTTSRDAARKIAPRAQTLRDQVLIAYRVAWPAGLTADEAAAKMGKSILSVRPRVTELRKTGDLMVVKNLDGSPSTRKNDSGVEAAVLVCLRPTGSSSL